MKKLIDYKEEIHKCSKCGLCQSVCPVYEQTGNDCAVSRGKFIMLNGVVKGDLNLNKNINKYLDMCLKCNACKDFCPSGIDAKEIFLTAKSEYFNSCYGSNFIKEFQSKFVLNTVLNCIKIAATTYRFLRFDKLVAKFYPILRKCKIGLGQKVILANSFIASPLRGEADFKYEQKTASIIKSGEGEHNIQSHFHPHPEFQTFDSQVEIHPSPLKGEGKRGFNVIYFKGCVNEYINPKVKNSVESILNQMGVNILSPNLPFDCCGVPFLSCGNSNQFKKQAEFNISQFPDDFDYFLTDCATCQSAFKDYEKYITDEKLSQKLKEINAKSINVADFIVQKAKKIYSEEKVTFTYHKPCHLDDMSFIEQLIQKSGNIEYIEMKDYNVCCGFAGEFAVKNTDLSENISIKKVQNAKNTKANYILTSCPSCILGLKQGEIALLNESDNDCKIDVKYLNVAEFLSDLTIEY